jgi:hypothetical protein
MIHPDRKHDSRRHCEALAYPLGNETELPAILPPPFIRTFREVAPLFQLGYTTMRLFR